MPPKVRRPKKLSVAELGRIVERALEAKTAEEADKLEDQFIEGWYGETIQQIRKRESRAAKRLETGAKSSRLPRTVT